MICPYNRKAEKQVLQVTNEYDEDGNATPGYTTTVPRARDLTQAERASRQLKGCKFTARLAGAIHYVEVRGTLEY